MLVTYNERPLYLAARFLFIFTSLKLQAASLKLLKFQASSGKLQASRKEVQASSRKLQAASSESLHKVLAASV